MRWNSSWGSPLAALPFIALIIIVLTVIIGAESFNPAQNPIQAADSVDSKLILLSKPCAGGDGVCTEVSSANPMPVQLNGTNTVSTTVSSVDPEDSIFAFLTWESGAQGADTENLIVATASVITPSVFVYEVPAGKIAYLSRVNVLMRDTVITISKFGGLATLSNGCIFEARDTDDSTLEDFTNGKPIKMNAHFDYLAGIDAVVAVGAGVDAVAVRWTIAKAYSGRPLKLTAGQKFVLLIRDSMTGLDEFRIMIQGWLADA